MAQGGQFWAPSDSSITIDLHSFLKKRYILATFKQIKENCQQKNITQIDQFRDI